MDSLDFAKLTIWILAKRAGNLIDCDFVFDMSFETQAGASKKQNLLEQQHMDLQSHQIRQADCYMFLLRHAAAAAATALRVSSKYRGTSTRFNVPRIWSVDRKQPGTRGFYTMYRGNRLTVRGPEKRCRSPSLFYFILRSTPIHEQILLAGNCLSSTQSGPRAAGRCQMHCVR